MRELLSERVIAAANDVALSRGGLKSNYERLFGTPERAARTICRQLKHFNICICDGCPVKPPNKECDSEYDALLEWLKGEGKAIDEPDTIRNELADGGLIADVLAPVYIDEKERRAFQRGRVHERFAQQIFKEAES